MHCSETRPRKCRAFAASFALAMCHPAKLLEPTYSTLPCCTRSRTPARSRPTSPPGRRGASGTGRCGRSAGGGGCPRTPGGCGTPTGATRSATSPSRCRPSSRARPCRGGPRPSRTSSRRSSRSRRRPCAAVDVRGVEEVDAELERPVHDRVAVALVGLRAEVHRPEAQRGHHADRVARDGGTPRLESIEASRLSGDRHRGSCSR